MASFSSNRALLLSLLVAVSGFMAAPSSVEAQLVKLEPKQLILNGTVFCTRKIKLTANGTVPSYLPPFRQATVMLRCREAVLATAITDASGKFSIVSESKYVINPVFYYFLSGGAKHTVDEEKCQLIVKELLSRCDFTLPTRQLVAEISASLQYPLNQLPGGILKPIIGLFILPPEA